MDEDKNIQIALFKFSLIAPFIHINDDESINAIVESIANRQYEIPFSKKTKVCKRTVYNYLKQYKEHGFSGLKKKERNDKDTSRSIEKEILDELIYLKKEKPERSARRIIQLIHLDPKLENVSLSERTVSRIFLNLGLTRKQLLPKKIHRSFEMEHINELWETDIMDGLFLTACKKKTYLFAFIDDYSRLIPHAQFYFDEKLPRLEDCLKKAILKRGIPKRIYTDNGKVFVSNHLKRICAELGVKLIHHLPYSPQSKGKIERFFLRVQKEYISEAKSSNITSIDQLNSFFSAWLEVSYHRTEHYSLGTTPIDRFIADMKNTKIKQIETVEEITEIFLYREKRKVAKTRGTISLYRNHYQIEDISLLDKEVEVYYDPFDLSQIFVYFKSVFQQVAYPIGILKKKAIIIPEESKKGESEIRKSSMEFFTRLKQKETELNKKGVEKIDFSKIMKEEENDK